MFRKEAQGDGLYRYRCVSCTSARYNKRSRLKKIRLLEEIGGGKCYLCGYMKSIEALTFHHIDPEDKEFQISYKMGYSYKVLLEEAKKCIILCANCHAEVESGVCSVIGQHAFL